MNTIKGSAILAGRWSDEAADRCSLGFVLPQASRNRRRRRCPDQPPVYHPDTDAARVSAWRAKRDRDRTPGVLLLTGERAPLGARADPDSAAPGEAASARPADGEPTWPAKVEGGGLDSRGEAALR